MGLLKFQEWVSSDCYKTRTQFFIPNSSKHGNDWKGNHSLLLIPMESSKQAIKILN